MTNKEAAEVLKIIHTDENGIIRKPLEMAIKALEQEPCDDAISRQAAIDALGEEPEVWTGNDEYAQGLNNQWHYDVNALKALPSAQPERKKGHWIEVDDHYNRISGRCSACGWESHLYEDDVVGMHFCPNCGADMRGEQDE